MLNKLAKVVSVGMLVSGFVFMIGTVGASDAGMIGFSTLVIRGSLSALLMGIGLLGSKLSGCEFVY